MFESLGGVDGALQETAFGECSPVRDAGPGPVGAGGFVGRVVVFEILVAVGRVSPLARAEVAEKGAEGGHAACDQGEVMLDAA